MLRQGIGSIVLHKEVLGAPEGEVQLSELQKSSNLDQLASAAVSTAGWNTVLAPGLSSSVGGHNQSIKHKIKTKLSTKELTAARLMKSEDERAAYSLKYLLTGNAEDAAEPSNITARLSKKRKTESLPDHHHPSISVGAEETVSTEATLDGETGEMVPYVPPKVSKIHRRTASPRILSGAKARRQRAKSEKSDSESTEPLMSSCLLLLEAATRLDDAEKEKTADGVKTRGKGRGSARTSVTSAAARAGKIFSKHDTESDGDSEPSSPKATDETMIITADQDLHRVLRKTLESLKNRTPKLPKQSEESTITLEMAHDGWEEGEELRDAVVVVSETQEVKGLFSGSNIGSESSTNALQERPEEDSLDMVQIQSVEGHATSHLDNAEESAQIVDAAVIEEAIIEGAQDAEYVEMMLPEEEGVTYIEGDDVPGEIIIQSVGDEQFISKEESDSVSSSALIEHIPPGSILLQTGDGTPIGMIDAQGKLTAFQSPEARSVISILTSKISASSTQEAVATAHPSELSSDTVATVVSSSGVPILATTPSDDITYESPHSGSVDASDTSVVVKQEPVVDDSSISQGLINTDVVKVERVDAADHDSPSTHEKISINGFMSEAETMNPQSNIRKICQSLLVGLVPPYTFDGIMSNFKKSLHSLQTKSGTFSPGLRDNTEVCPIKRLERLEDLCKFFFIRLCFSTLSSEATQKVSTSTARARPHHSKKITVLPGVQLPVQKQQVVKTNSDVTYDSKGVIDPTTPFSLGEIPLFASTKGDSDSMSPPSE